MKRALLAIAAWLICTATARAADTNIGGLTLKDQEAAKAMHAEATAIRARAGLAAQELDEELCQLSQRWANYMASTGAFHHGGGENIIAHGYPTVRAAFAGWMNSGGHRAWLLSGTTRAGWGYQERNGRAYWVGTFRNHERTRTVTRTTTTTAEPSAEHKAATHAHREHGRTLGKLRSAVTQRGRCGRAGCR